MIWTILGFSVGIVAFFCIAVAEVLVGKPVFEDNRLYIAGVFVAAGVTAWFVGRHLGGKKRALQKDDEEAPATSRFLLFDLRYWGPMFVVLGVITIFIRPLRQEKVERVAAPAPPPAPKTNVVAAVAPPPKPEAKPKVPAVFPSLKVQGIIYRESQPFAIINGESYAVGDQLGEVLVKAIDRTSVSLELSGELKTLTLN